MSLEDGSIKIYKEIIKINFENSPFIKGLPKFIGYT